MVTSKGVIVMPVAPPHSHPFSLEKKEEENVARQLIRETMVTKDSELVLERNTFLVD